MPILRITSLPFSPDSPNTQQVTARWPLQISERFAALTDIPLKNISVTWQFLPSGHYAYAGSDEPFQQPHSPPLLVDLLLPDFYALDRVDRILLAAAESVAAVSGVVKKTIFIQVHKARSGTVFDDGRIIRW